MSDQKHTPSAQVITGKPNDTSKGTPVATPSAVTGTSNAAPVPNTPATPNTPSEAPKGNDAATPRVLPDLTATASTDTGKGETAPVDVSAAKGKGKKGKAAEKAAPAGMPQYNFAAWPKWLVQLDDKGNPVIENGQKVLAIPGTAEILAAHTLLANRNGPTKKVLAAAFYLSPQAKHYNVDDVAVALKAICGGAIDKKLNVINEQLAYDGWVKRLDVAAQVTRNPGNTDDRARPKICYPVELQPKGRALVEKALTAANIKMPRHFMAKAA